MCVCVCVCVCVCCIIVIVHEMTMCVMNIHGIEHIYTHDIVQYRVSRLFVEKTKTVISRGFQLKHIPSGEVGKTTSQFHRHTKL